MKIAIASDHGGFDCKQVILPVIKELGHEALDLGCFDTASVDYPDYAQAAAKAVSAGECDLGIVVCGTGIGIGIAANKLPGIRCALCTDQLMAQLSREHNNANMLALGGRIIGPELAKAIVVTFLTTPFSGAPRHAARIEKISRLEER